MKFQNFNIFSLLVVITLLPSSTLAQMRALHTAATGMAAQETNVNTISNNIANLGTTAYKKRRAEFESLLYETIQEAGARSSGDSQYSVGLQIGSGSKISSVRKNFTQGSPQVTNNPFDLMINGDGFFGVMHPSNQIYYTRDGSFNVDNQGQIVNSNGNKLMPVVVVPPNTINVSISENGQIEAYIRNQTEPVNLGQIPVYTFVNPVGLKSIGKNLLEPSQSSGAPISNIAGESNAGIIQQGFLEASNVSVMNEMTGLIKAQRSYEMNSKVMRIADEMLQTINNIR